ncbi:MAG: hypothetical protein RL684_2655, partial [Pseudomonadota bacterium]
ASLQPARIGAGRGEAWVNANNGERLGSREGFDPRGPSDKSVDVVRLESLDGRPIALLVNYASHAEVMFRSTTRDGGYEVTGDLPGAVSSLLEAQPGGAPVVLYTAGAEGDQHTIFKSLQPAGRLPAADAGAAGWALLDAMSRRVASNVLDVTAQLEPGTSTVEIHTAKGTATCPGQKLRVDQQTGKVTTEDRPPVDIPLATLRINDIVLAGVGGDVGTEIGQHLKAESPFRHTTMVTMAGDPVGYLLTDASYERPGHGIAGSPVKAGCADQAVVGGLLKLLNVAH